MPTAWIILLRKSVELFFCTGAFVNVVLPMVRGMPALAEFVIVLASCGGDIGGFFGETSLI